MLPGTSLCLNIPKTGTSYTARFFAAADWLHLKHACRLRGLYVPNRAAVEFMNTFKRLGVRYGSLNPALRRHHTGYSTLPARLRVYPRLCALREVKGWYCSQYLYYTRRLKPPQLGRAIAFLVHGRKGALESRLRTILLRHRVEFLERFRDEQAGPESIEKISVRFLDWFNRTIRAAYKLKLRFGVDTSPAHMGLLTFHTIVLLFDDPARVLSQPEEAIEEYFAGGRFRRDLRADFYLRFDALCAVMAGELGYHPGILDFLAESIGRRNVSPVDLKPRVAAELQADGLIERIRRRERIYERYLLPLAGTPARDESAAQPPLPPGRRSEAPAR